MIEFHLTTSLLALGWRAVYSLRLYRKTPIVMSAFSKRADQTGHRYCRYRRAKYLHSATQSSIGAIEQNQIPRVITKSRCGPEAKLLEAAHLLTDSLTCAETPLILMTGASLGNEGWAYEDVLPYFKQIESYDGGEEDYRGRNGRLRITDVPAPHMLSSLFVDAAYEAGIPRAADYNGCDQEGASLAQTTIHSGFRQSASRAFLRDALTRPNVTLITYAYVEAVNIDAGLMTGVTYRKRGETKRLIAEREVLLCAGAVATPQLLMLSGIGPRDHLEDMGIETMVDLPGVGENLQEHCGIWIMQGVRKGIRTANMDYNLFGILKHGLRYLLTRGGQVATPTSQALAFIKTRPTEHIPDA